MVSLRRRKVDVNPWCPNCKCKEETDAHTLFVYYRAKYIWNKLFLAVWNSEFKRLNCSNTWLMLFDHLSNEKLARACITAWEIWGDRNKACLQSLIPSVDRRCAWILNYVAEFSSLSKESLTPILKDSPSYGFLGGWIKYCPSGYNLFRGD